jgi:glycosyltransferase involved in cell wall biosynthesis
MDIVCFSHLRWNFVFQRPQHILSRLAKPHRVFYIEEPVFNEQSPTNYNEMSVSPENVLVVTPHIAYEQGSPQVPNVQHVLLDELMNSFQIKQFVLWYYTPMALPHTRHIQPYLTVYDCMDELSAFKFAPPTITQLEAELFEKADVVFTGGHSLYDAKKHLHHNIHAFPSSIDKDHFGRARTNKLEPEDQKHIPYPRLGFFGVIDERFDIDLIEKAAAAKPDWQFVLIGPVVKIDPATLPKRDNIHYLGGKQYSELPSYISGWDIALVPFAINESTRFISPTKTPEYLAAGKPVISTPIRDVVHPYGTNKLVHIVNDAEELVAAAEEILQKESHEEWLAEVDGFLANNSWDNTCCSMVQLLRLDKIQAPYTITQRKEVSYV